MRPQPAANRSTASTAANKPAGVAETTQSEASSKQQFHTDDDPCPTTGAVLRQPVDGASNVGTTVTFRWDAVNHGKRYTVAYTVDGGNGKDVILGTTDEHTTTLRKVVPDGQIKWKVITDVDKCGSITSSAFKFTTGAAQTPATPPNDPPTPPTTNPGTPTPPPTDPGTPTTNPPADPGTPDPSSSCVAAPSAAAVAQAVSGSSYEVRWAPVAAAKSYIVDEATSADFSGAHSTATIATSVTFSHAADAATVYFYRVRAVGACSAFGGPASATVRVVVLPQAAVNPGRNDSGIVAPFGTTERVTKQIVIDAGASGAYIATASEDWMSVSPASGTIGADGKVTLTISADAAALQVGSSTATVSLTLLGASANGIASNAGAKVVTIPVSVTLITPVSGASTFKATEDTLIIPAVAHADGNNSHWQSDLRITHTFANAVTYNIVYVPSGGIASNSQQTTVTVNAGDTIALDDVLSRWFGAGTLGDSATGLIAIQPSTPLGRNGMTFAASRLYNVTAEGSFGQFVPAVPLAKFTAAGSGSELALTALAQSAEYRTNFGLVEGSGFGASVLLSAYDGAGRKLFEQMLTLAPGEHRNVGALLAANGVTSPNVRVGAKVMSAQGSAFAYASVVDNSTGDPLFVPAVDTSVMKATHAVVPGVAELATTGGRWQSDVRIFNPSPASVTATLSYFPQGATTAIATKQLTIEPGAVLALDNVLANTFGTTSSSGALQIDSTEPLVTNARTYNQREGGTYGQFITAATVDDATGIGERPLEILQLEESTRFRSNVGLAEITGHAATVEVTATLPGHKLAATFRIDLGPNEFRQIGSLLSSMGMSDAYNASMAVRVVGGVGRVTGYASVIDNATQDPTFISAQ